MKKGRIANGMQRTIIFGCIASLMAGFIFTEGKDTVAVEIDGKTEICTLDSVTLTIPTDENATPVTITGGLQPIIVDKNASWNDYFGNRTIGDVIFREDDACTAKGKENHSFVAGYVFAPDGNETGWKNMRTVNRQETEDGMWYEWMCTTPWQKGNYNYVSSNQIALDESAGYYDVKFEPRFGMIDGTSPTGIYVRFAKEYDITYNLDGGMLADDVVKTYVAGAKTTLPTPTKEGYVFIGWTNEEMTTPVETVEISADATGECIFTANWVKIKEISVCDITFKDRDTYAYTGTEIKPAVVVKDGEKVLVEGKDYKVSYANHVNAATKDAQNAPTVTVIGLNAYEGSKKVIFTITKASLMVEEAPSASVIVEGSKLSDSTLTGGKVVNEKKEAVAGTFSWKDGEVVPTLADSGVTKYAVVFTPQDTANYETVETTVVVTVNKKVDESPTLEPKIEVGEKAKDKDNKATYKVIKSAEDKVEVSYVAPTKKTKKVTIPTIVTLADGTKAKVTSIAAGAFKKNTTLQEVTISANVKTIGKEAFSGCKNLKKVKSAKNVTSIGKNAFANCTKLTSVAMGNKLESVGEKAFYKCTALEKITIPKNVKSIGTSAFQGCSKLKSVTIKTTKLTKNNVNKNAFKGIYAKAKIDVPNSKKKAYTSMLRSRGVSKKASIK